MAATAHSCILCDSLNANMDRYVATFFHLYEHDAEFRAKLEASKGFCLPDAALLLERGDAPEKLRLLNAGERLPAQGSVRQLYHALGLDAQGVVCAVKEVLA